MSSNNIIILSDVYAMKEAKEKELAYYEEHLKELEKKMFFIRKEIDLTNFIINIIEKEKLVVIGEEYDESD